MKKQSKAASDSEAALKKNLEKIAKDKLRIETLDTRHSDSLDFYEVAVWNVEAALKEAYELGFSSKTDDTEFIGTTTLRRILSAVYDENDPLNSTNSYSECGGAHLDFEADPSIGDRVVYVYYHPRENQSIMTTVEGDTWGAIGSSAGFNCKLTLETLAPGNEE